MEFRKKCYLDSLQITDVSLKGQIPVDCKGQKPAAKNIKPDGVLLTVQNT